MLVVVALVSKKMLEHVECWDTLSRCPRAKFYMVANSSLKLCDYKYHVEMCKTPFIEYGIDDMSFCLRLQAARIASSRFELPTAEEVLP